MCVCVCVSVCVSECVCVVQRVSPCRLLLAGCVGVSHYQVGVNAKRCVLL